MENISFFKYFPRRCYWRVCVFPSSVPFWIYPSHTFPAKVRSFIFPARSTRHSSTSRPLAGSIEILPPDRIYCCIQSRLLSEWSIERIGFHMADADSQKKEERKLITSFFSHKFLSLGKRWYSSPFFFPFLRIKQRRRGKMNISGWQPRVWERQIYSAGWKEAPMAFHAFSVTFKSQLFRFCSEAQLIRCWKPVHGRIIDRQSPFIALGEQKVSTVAHDQCIAPLCLLVHLNGSLLMRISGQSEELLA